MLEMCYEYAAANHIYVNSNKTVVWNQIENFNFNQPKKCTTQL